jgi:LAGLIDADG endonuclease
MLTKLMAKKIKFKRYKYFRWFIYYVNVSKIKNKRLSSAFHRNYTSFNANLPCEQINKNSSTEFLSHYLAGLIEGDGYISITNENRVILGITFNLKDKPLAEKLLNYLGKGTIVKRKSNSVELRFSSKKTLCNIIRLINGKFRTPKIEQLYNLIN